ncbi:hypothetical protein FE782_22115 [Paenibacillus antri]|uniref:AAA+ ATPase domain-containing protein n=1 Tax=Paenibacillus antri TaxID=2582848 RepID=A0A5R9GF51_9BACL|nr:TniB family NTP-binding protein [Paenibacillus antri]TLS50035.1 hypothetical protein FE782_22115 [Paenibacillus antri]
MDNPYKALQKRMLGVYVEHSEVKRIWERLDYNRWLKRNSPVTTTSPICLFIQGKPGSGKTLCVKKYVERNKNYTEQDQEGNKTEIFPVLLITMPMPLTQKELYLNILRALGVPVNPGTRDIGTIKHQAFQLLRDLKVEMLIIDELDYAIKYPDSTRRLIMEHVKDIANTGDICLVCVGTQETEVLRTLNSQHIRRYPKTVLNHFDECDDRFVQFIKEIENQVASPVKLYLSDQEFEYPALIHQLTGGLVGWITPILQEAFRIIGVLDNNFNDFSLLNNLNASILIQARNNVMGEFADEDIKKIFSQS